MISINFFSCAMPGFRLGANILGFPLGVHFQRDKYWDEWTLRIFLLVTKIVIIWEGKK